MKRDEALHLLKKHWDDLKQFDVKSLAIFGSVARNEARSSSDLDVLIDFHHSATFKNFFGAKNLMEDALKVRVDLVTVKSLRLHARQLLEKDIIYVS